MSPRPIPDHGTTARAYGSRGYRERCTCQPCRDAGNRHGKQLRVNRELGRSPFTPPDRARAHLQMVHQTMTWLELTEVTGFPISNLIRIYNGQRKKIRKETEATILAIKAPAQGGPGQCIDATGTMRRVRALSHVGHSYDTIAKAAQTSRNRILLIANGRQATVRRAVAERLAAAYHQLAFAPPPRNKHTNRSRNEARAKGWDGPLAWDDNIDDPKAQPEQDAPYQPVAENGRDSLRMAEIEHLYLLGESPESIAKQLDGNEKYVRDLIGAVVRRRAARAEQERAAARAQHTAEAYSEQLLATA
ncbi:helix-turn-helix transcriptional regulator [Streptomyces sp. NPDC051453]|uniref:helix-turn-helix domain-containing protein n=1 Tax=Streptomyces sp. NPDC051453 TaxID=3154941 RepID=UPI0034253209